MKPSLDTRRCGSCGVELDCGRAALSGVVSVRSCSRPAAVFCCLYESIQAVGANARLVGQVSRQALHLNNNIRGRDLGGRKRGASRSIALLTTLGAEFPDVEFECGLFGDDGAMAQDLRELCELCKLRG